MLWVPDAAHLKLSTLHINITNNIKLWMVILTYKKNNLFFGLFKWIWSREYFWPEDMCPEAGAVSQSSIFCTWHWFGLTGNICIIRTTYCQPNICAVTSVCCLNWPKNAFMIPYSGWRFATINCVTHRHF